MIETETLQDVVEGEHEVGAMVLEEENAGKEEPSTPDAATALDALSEEDDRPQGGSFKEEDE